MYTRAIPASGPRYPIQLIDVPLKGKVACAPGPDDIDACESVLFRPVTSIVSVWLPLARPFALKTGTWTSYDLANMSTWDTKTPSTETRAMPLSGPRMQSQVTEVPVKANVA